jgi:hypothetical protein
MRRMRKASWWRWLTAAPLLFVWGAAPSAAQAQTSGCQLTLGFQALHDAVPDVVGSCTGDVAYLLNGDAQQRTANGLLAWVKADNLTKFTDGNTTWIDSPDGVVSRLNSERFPWESPTSNVAAATISRSVDPASLVARPGDPGVPRGYVLSSESTQPGGEFSLTLRSFTKPDQSITTKVVQEPSKAEAQAVLTAISASYPKSNRVLGQEGDGFQNDGTAFVGDESTMLESKDLLILHWVRGSYLFEIDDASGQGLGSPTVLGHDVDDRLKQQLQLPS